jgi:hypothetical protein
MLAPRYPLSSDLRSAGATPSRSILLTFIFVSCLLAAVVLTFKAAYGFIEVFEEAPTIASLPEQAVALGSMLLSVFGLFAVYMKKLCA